MIYTVTFNPAIDYVIRVEDFKIGEVNRVEYDKKYPGGKGINVSRVLKNLNVKSMALGFIGGFTGDFIEKFLKNEGLLTDFVRVNQDTRINVKLSSNEETEINGEGSTINEGDLKYLFKKIEALNAEDFLVLAGNVQKSLPKNIYAQILEMYSGKNIKFVVDTTGEALTSTLKYKPFLIKPNRQELSEIFETKIDTQEEIIYYAKKLIDMGAQNVIVSMASKGALLICNEGIYHASAPKGIVKNSVGAGDSLIAGFLSYYSTKFDLLEAFKWGAASGSATAFSFDLCTKDHVDELIKQITITKI